MADKIVLLHGIGAHRLTLYRGEKYFRDAGYDVLNITYPSITKSLEDIADIIHVQVSKFNNMDDKISFIGHSMGGLVTLVYLNKYSPLNLHKVIFLGTPIKGSKIADFMRQFRLYEILFGPAGQQLITKQGKFIKLFHKFRDYIGIIAGNKSLFLFEKILEQQPNDGMVTIYSAVPKWSNAIILPVNHINMMFSIKVWKQALFFIKNGEFQKI